MDLNEVKTAIQNHISGIASSIGKCAPIARTITGETIESLADLLVDRTTGQDIFNDSVFKMRSKSFTTPLTATKSSS